MATLQTGARSTKRVVLSSMISKKGLTVLLVGKHGIGKSDISAKVAADLNAAYLIVEGGGLKEGEFLGHPFIMNIKEMKNSLEFKKFYEDFINEKSNVEYVFRLIEKLKSTAKSIDTTLTQEEVDHYTDLIGTTTVESFVKDMLSRTNEEMKEVAFVKYYLIKMVERYEKYYFEIAKTKGFLNGEVKLEIDAEGNYYLVEFGNRTLVKSALDAEVDTQNKFEFGKDFTQATKLKLIESGEVKPVILFIDELNRTDSITMKELMNVVLTKAVNGYELPWWCSIFSAINPCSQNSVYATNEMDPAQLDRFLKIKVESNLEEWVNYALDKGLNSDCIEAIAMSEDLFDYKDSSLDDQSEMHPSPRSWEMVAHIYDTLELINKTKFFTPEERKYAQDDLRILVRGKVGETAGRTFLENISRKENNIKPQEILTMDADKVPAAVMKKFLGQRRLTQLIIANNVFTYINSNLEKLNKLKNGKTPEDKTKYANFGKQLNEFVTSLDTATQVTVLNNFIKRYGRSAYAAIASTLSKSVLENIVNSRNALKDLIGE